MQYDPEQNAMVDTETGALIPLSEGDDIPEEMRAEIRGSSMAQKLIQQKKDFAYARSLQNDEREEKPTPTGYKSSKGNNFQSDYDMAMALSLSSGNGTQESIPVFLSESTALSSRDNEKRRLDQEAADREYALSLSGQSGSRSKGQNFPVSNGDIELLGVNNDPAALSPPMQEAGGSGWFDDLSLARALQAMEFEIASEMRHNYGGEALTPEQEEFYRKENKATKCKRQMLTISTLTCLAQIGLLVAMIQDDGYAPKSENPMYGPDAYTLVRYGAKDAALIKYRNEWWRLVTPIFLHAGIIHIISNVAIQLRVGGYLEIVFGKFRWVVIYFASGIYGNMLSCIFLPDSVGVGSSGALLGMLTAWIVWIIFRWRKVPPESKGQRNCQLVVVTAAVALTLAFSFTDYVDWAAHFGGAIQGCIAGLMMLSKEIENYYLRWGIRSFAALCFVVSFMWAAVYMIEIMKPSKAYLDVYDRNDDWG